MNKYLLCMLIGIVFGILGTFCFLIIGSENKGQKDNGYGQLVDIRTTIDRIQDENRKFREKQEYTLKEMSGEISEMKIALDRLSENRNLHDTNVAVEDLPKKERMIPSDPISTKFDDYMKKNIGWYSVLDSRLVRVLVEEGLTPFDSGVSPFVKEASSKLKVVDKLYSNTITQIKTTYDIPNVVNTRHPQYDVYKLETQNASIRRKEDREEIISKFRSSLESLKRNMK